MARANGKVKTMPCATCRGSGAVPDFDAGKALRDEREKLGLHRTTVAAELSYSQEYLRDLETGHRRVSVDMVEKYRAALDKLAQKEER